ncbi:MAG: glycosyltransferase [Parvularculaceae bacterium]|nr:glycosyltransferase [Parvularculaceae bacterium]
MKLLTVTTLYPNAAAPEHGVFVENRLAAWRRHSGGEARVIAPVPWFPSTAPIFGVYARYAAAPKSETRRSVDISHPRYFLPPRVGMDYAPAALARVMEREARAVLAGGYDFDLIDAHYLYPDGVAAVRVAKRLGKPVVLTARGSDVTLFPEFPRQRALILDAVRRADAVIAVAAALKNRLVELGAPAEKIAVLGNGVDLTLFRPLDRDEIRGRMGLSGDVIASVGGLIERKGHDIAIRTLGSLPDATLLIAGEGPEEPALKALAGRLGVGGRVRFLGQVAHEALAEIYNAADALVLASTREGWPNVLLESMACGAPAVAADVGGCAEVVTSPAAGRIVRERTSEAFAAALREVLSAPTRAATRAHAASHSWDETSRGLSVLYEDVVARAAAGRAVRFRPIEIGKLRKAKLIFTVDTEEQFDWSGFSPDGHKVCDPKDVDRLQKVCEAFGVKPLYFITFPLLTDARSAGYFRMLAEEGRADLGMHLHQWNTPPIGGYAGEYYSWQANLPPRVQAAKLRALAEAFESAFGYRPVAHRAGRYGVSAQAYRALADIGVTFDFSPSVSFDFSAGGGPDFSAMANDPFVAETDQGAVQVTPVCGAFALRGGSVFLKQRGAPGLIEGRRRHARRLTAPFRLSCEQARLHELVALTKSLVRAGTPILTFSLHSTTMTAGANSYSPDEASVSAHLDLTRRYLEFFTKDYGGEAVDLDGLGALYRGAR